MLNRLYIVVGILAIIVLSAAFLVPRFVQWGDYRGRLEAIAGEVLGAKVEIIGDIKFSLLPQPQLSFANVVVGPAEEPVITVERVDAEFSLLDFLRDRYALTKLVLAKPSVALNVDARGQFTTGLSLPQQVTESNVSVASANIIDGVMRLADARSGETFSATAIQGEVSLDALRGPFSFQGRGRVEGVSYTLRLSTGALDERGTAQLSAFARPLNEAFSIAADGSIVTGPSPRFIGDMTFRQAPPPAEDADAVRGDLVFTAKAEATPEKVLLSAYTLVPDENRSGTRLAGAAVVTLGATRSFDAVISGGVFGLVPRDATEDQSGEPYELVRLLAELPGPLVPAMQGTIGVDIAEFDLRAISLRNLRLDAATDGNVWTVKEFSAQLPGNTALRASGRLSNLEGHPGFSGSFTLDTKRLDALALLWRKPAASNPLFNMPGSLEASIELTEDTLSVADGRFVLDGTAHSVAARVRFGADRGLAIAANFSDVSPAHADALLALAPTITTGGEFGRSFPEGTLSFTAASATAFGLTGTGLTAKGRWGADGMVLERVAATDLGGIGFDVAGIVGGTLAKPSYSGEGMLSVSSADAPALQRVFETMAVPEAARTYFSRSLPAELDFTLGEMDDAGWQRLTMQGRAGAANLTLSAALGGPLAEAFASPFKLDLELISGDVAALTAQIGLGELPILSEGPMNVALRLEGMPSNSLETRLTLTGGAEQISFTGNVTADSFDLLNGTGRLELQLADLSPLATVAGAEGLTLPDFSGQADLEFQGLQTIGLTGIDGTASDEPVGGELVLRRTGGLNRMTGAITIGGFDLPALARVIGGPAAPIALEGGVWPDGPLDMGANRRSAGGEVQVTTGAVAIGEGREVAEARFVFAWDDTSVSVREFTGTLGGGSVSADLTVCCAGPLQDKQVTGRMTLATVPLASVLPPLPASTLTGSIDLAAKYDGTGSSIAAILAGLNGEGSFTASGLRVNQLDPRAFQTLAGLSNIVELDAEALSSIVAMAVDAGPFATPKVEGSFTIAGGVVRAPNLAAEGNGGHLFGGVSMGLADLALNGAFTLSPRGLTDPTGLISEATSGITSVIGGTLLAPVRTLDIGTMVDTIKVRAYEVEVARLEQLRAEDEARSRAAAAERERLIREQAERLAAEEAAERAAEEARRDAQADAIRAADEEATRQAAVEEAAQRAAEQEAARRAAEAAAQQTQDTPPPFLPPLDIGVPPAQ